MKNIIEYKDYINSPYCGIIPPNEQSTKRILVRASNIVRMYIMNKDYSKYKDLVKDTTCSVANILYNQFQAQEKMKKIALEGNITSEKIGNWSRNYNTSISDLKEIADNTKVNEEIRNVIEENLYYTGLLYRGIGNV